MAEKKYLSIGSLVEFDGSDPLIQIDNVNLKELLDFLSEHGKTYLKGLTKEEIMAAQKLKKDDPNRIPRISVYMFDPGEKAPSFIKSNLAVKIR